MQNKFNLNLRINDLALFCLSFTYLLCLLINPVWYTNWFIVVLSLVNAFCFSKFSKYHLKIVLIIFCLLIPISLALFTTCVVFKPAYVTKDESYLLGLELVSRMYVLFIAPLLAFIVIDFEGLILYCMQRLNLPVVLGYSILSAINAFKYFSVEIERIRYAFLMRYAKKKINIFVLYSFLVSATRYAFHQGISMESRGLNPKKTFVHQVRLWRKLDTLVILGNLFILTIIIYYRELKQILC